MSAFEEETRRPRWVPGTIAHEAHVACPADLWASLNSRLWTDAPNEACTFLITRPSRGKRRTTVLLSHPVWPESGDVEASPESLEISSNYISRAIDAAIDAGPLTGLALVHTHPDGPLTRGIGRFSWRDDWYDHRLFATAMLARRSGLGASIVLARNSAELHARIFWWDNSKLSSQDAQVLRVVGPRLSMFETPASGWRDHPDPAVFDRSVRVFGRQGQRLLQNVRVGVVGLGGTGSVCLAALSTMGIGGIRCWDGDLVEKTNRPRLLGSANEDIGRPKTEALGERAQRFATADPSDVSWRTAWGTSHDSLREILDCDVIFSCLDSLAGRVPLNDTAYAHLVPVIDMGSRVYLAGERITDVLCRAQVLTPGLPCLWCSGLLSSERLTREAQGVQAVIERRIPYGIPLTLTDGVEPSVLPLNMTSASLALMSFTQLCFHLAARTPQELRVRLPQWELDENELPSRPGCSCRTDIALGDELEIRPFIPPARPGAPPVPP